MGEAEERKGPGFTVVDKRGSGEEEAAPAEAPSAAPAVDFASFCLSLATSALYHMGVAVDPEGRDTIPQKNLPLAQQTIDSLEMLQGKTRGNLDSEEQRLLESLLYELRMHFVEASSGSEAGSDGGAAPESAE